MATGQMSKAFQKLCERSAKQLLILQTLKEPQSRFFWSDRRFNVCACGRRSGKTHLAKLRVARRVSTQPGQHFIAAPTFGQVKRLYWKDMKELLGPVTKGKPSETDLVITLLDDTELHLFGLDKPERAEGTPWRSGLIDEFADTKEQAWLENIRPALSTEGLLATCDIIGVPDGLNHFYDRFENAKIDPEWDAHHWKSSIVLSQKEIEDAKRDLDPRTFRQEYEASFETATGVIYSDYGDDNHTYMEFRPGDIHWTHDFNFLPMSSAIIQTYGDKDYVVDEIILDHAIARDVGKEFVERYKDHKNCMVYLYGDPSGKAGEKHGQISNYLAIEEELRNAGFRYERRVLSSTRSIRDSQASLRGRILNAKEERRLFVNPKKSPTTDRGLKTAQLKKGSTFLEDDTNRNQHITTALRYMTEYRYPVFGEMKITVS